MHLGTPATGDTGQVAAFCLPTASLTGFGLSATLTYPSLVPFLSNWAGTVHSNHLKKTLIYEIEFKSAGLTAGTFTHCIIPLPPWWLLFIPVFTHKHTQPNIRHIHTTDATHHMQPAQLPLLLHSTHHKLCHRHSSHRLSQAKPTEDWTMQGPEAFISVEMGCDGRLENCPVGSYIEVPSLFLPLG